MTKIDAEELRRSCGSAGMRAHYISATCAEVIRAHIHSVTLTRIGKITEFV
jgi:hypothetical protein